MMLPNKIRSAQRGFTLIEVMVALVFVAMGIATIIQVTTAYVSNIVELEKRLLASWVASNHIAQMRFDAETNRVRSGSKTERMEMGGYRWRSKAKIKETDVERVFLVEVEVTADTGGDKKAYAVYTTAITENFQ